MKYLLFFCAALASIQLNATFYKGTIGEKSIYMQLNQDEEGVLYGSYFYESQALDIRFDGTFKGNRLDFLAGPFMTEDARKEHFILRKKGRTLVGKWKFGGRKRKVVLVEFQPSANNNPHAANRFFDRAMNELMDPLALVRSSLAEFQPTDSMTILRNGIELRWYKEAHWDSHLFRIAKGLPENQLKAANEYLEMIQLMSFCARGGCGDAGADSNAPYEYVTEIVHYFVNADFLSLETQDSYYCGGAHPDWSTLHWNFDMNQSKELTTEDLIQFSGFVIKSDENFDAWSEYRNSTFAALVTELLDSRYPRYFHPSDTSDETCDYHQLDVWSYSEVVITEEGFKFSAYFPRVERSCDDPLWAVLPYSDLDGFLNPEYRESLLSILP